MEVLTRYFPDLSADQVEKFGKLEALYADWNSKINVISRKDIDSLYVKHVLHSLGISRVCPFKPGASILDVGTGGGFPGIPLAILFPEVQFHLVDSIGKKIQVVQGVVSALGLANVQAEQLRAEQVKGKFDFVVSRAVTQIGEFTTWVKGKFKPSCIHSLPNGILYLKGGDLTEELEAIQHLVYMEYALSDYFREDFFETKKVLYVQL
ncbi:MAG: 16S rRNA (guanine(527)-N(7))-methyltransferase RsmG [Cytophagaceae bacterium]|jgi:16S rRNA (guanine527-N7)-methyltransferase|nr:16S rRNA (guanine(527)-N(7))-methyltransferase RsmG [Cytophagaceae bacterium]